MSEAIPPLPTTPSNRVAQLKARNYFTFIIIAAVITPIALQSSAEARVLRLQLDKNRYFQPPTY
jgi:hypothetical protein